MEWPQQTEITNFIQLLWILVDPLSVCFETEYKFSIKASHRYSADDINDDIFEHLSVSFFLRFVFCKRWRPPLIVQICILLFEILLIYCWICWKWFLCQNSKYCSSDGMPKAKKKIWREIHYIFVRKIWSSYEMFRGSWYQIGISICLFPKLYDI